MAARPTDRIYVGQLNLQGSKEATCELVVVARNIGLDIVLVQEQYCNHHINNLIQCGQSAKAGILVLNPNFSVTLLGHLGSDHCVVVHIVGGGIDLYAVSSYCQYNHDIATHLDRLSHIMDSMPGVPLLIGMDSNAHSPLWHCEYRQYAKRGPDTEYRRSQIENFILSRDLAIHNVEGQPPTFSGPNGSSNIDLTLSTRGVTVSEWRVHCSASLSDHQLITFESSMGGSAAATSTHDCPNAAKSYRERGVDWSLFRSVLHSRAGYLARNRPANTMCEDYSVILTRTAEECLGQRRDRDFGGYEWWNPQLDKMRREVGKARRTWQQSRRRGGELETILHDKLRLARSSYKQALKDAELAYYRRLAESGNDDPWGLAYRAACGRIRPPRNIIHGIELVGGHSTNTQETMSGLLHVLCPDDDSSNDSPYHHSVRMAAAIAPSGEDSDLPNRDDVAKIIRALPNTAPGLDGFTARMIRHAWDVSGDEMHHIFSACLSEGVFPDIWKVGRLVVLPKGNGKPLSDLKAFRPITLLPILGKILERLIIFCAPCLYRNISSAQHGFTRGRSTVSALNKVNDIVSSSDAKYVQLVFLDISGAFDNAWWPMILLKAKQCGCSPNVFRILVSYFLNRRVGLFVGDRAVWKVSTMGCPQGSVLGPTLWNLLLDDILRLPVPMRVGMVAYADDITVAIEASSRAEIERHAQQALGAVTSWGDRNRLTFSAHKSSTLTIKGRFKRPPCIRMGGTSIATVKQCKVLGVVMDEARSYVQHAEHAGEKGTRCFAKVSRVSTSSWGIRYHALRLLYGGTYVAILTYAAGVWYSRSSFYVVKRALLRTQRPALILLTKAYRTVSSAALPVLGAVLPADLEVIRAGRIEQGSMGRTDRERRKVKSEIRADCVSLWQIRWNDSEDGRELYSFFPDINERLKQHWVAPDYVVSQMLTGHGCFRAKLHKFKLSDNPSCPCGAESETRDHVLWDCPLYDDERNVMLNSLNKSRIGPTYHCDLVADENNFKLFRTFAHKWHEKRKSVR